MRHDSIVISDLHHWPDGKKGKHTLDRECECKPVVEPTSDKLNDFSIWHKD